MKRVLTHLALAVFGLCWSGPLKAEDPVADKAADRAAEIKAVRSKAKLAKDEYRTKPGDKAAWAAVIAAMREVWLAENPAFVVPAEKQPGPPKFVPPPRFQLVEVKPEEKPAEKRPAAKPEIALPAGAKVEVKAVEKPAEKPAADPPRVIVVPARPAAEVEARAQLNAQALQYEQMLLPGMWRELEFIKQNCDLTPDQRPKILAAARAGVRRAANDLGSNRASAVRNATGIHIRKEINASLETMLTEKQLADYRVQAARRNDVIKQTTVRSTVAILDGFLYLSREQRAKISENLLEHWDENWEQWMQVSRYGGRYFPMVPDKYLAPHLNERQQKVWNAAQKISAGVSGGENPGGNDEAWWSGKEAAEQPKDEAGEDEGESGEEDIP